MLAGHPKVEAAFHIAGPRAQGLHHIANEFASRHAWTLHMMHIRLIPLRR